MSASSVPAGAVEATAGWARAVLDDDTDAWWQILHHDLKVAEATVWVDTQTPGDTMLDLYDRDDAIAQLVAGTHRLADRFRAGRVRFYRSMLPTSSFDELAIMGDRRTTPEGHEVVFLVDRTRLPPLILSLALLSPDAGLILVACDTVEGWRIVSVSVPARPDDAV